MEAMLEHWTIAFVHELAIDLDDIVWRDAQQVRIVGCMMDFAEAEAVVDGWVPMGLIITDDVSRIE